jgi:hypothetical protein
MQLVLHRTSCLIIVAIHIPERWVQMEHYVEIIKKCALE